MLYLRVSGSVIWSSVFVTTNPHTKPCCVSNSLVPVNSTIILTINAHDNSSGRYAIYLHYYNEEQRSIVPLVKAEMVLKDKPVAFTFDPTDGRITTLGTNEEESEFIKRRGSGKRGRGMERMRGKKDVNTFLFMNFFRLWW